jgi:hypothetical protein
MTWLAGQTGIQAGSLYAIVQSASMGGAATGLVATIGSTPVGGALAALGVPVALVGRYFGLL